MTSMNTSQEPLSNDIIANLAYQTAVWYDELFIQAKRMLQTVKENHGEMRWDCDKQYANPFAEKILFVFTLYNAHIYIKRLNEMLQQKGDFSFDEIAQRFIEDSKFQEIKNLRNMNVHHYEYFTGGGRDRKSFEHVIRDGNTNVCTNEHWYYENGSTGNIYVGGVEITSVINTYFQNRDETMEKLKCVFEGYLLQSESE